MKITALLSVCSLVVASSLFAAEQVTTKPVIISHDKLTAAFEKGGPLLDNAHYRVQAGHRTGPGKVEIHAHDTDIFYVTKGSATIYLGGEAVDAKEVRPGSGEFGADKSIGGKKHELKEGDVIVIPAGVPHWMTEVSNPFDYLVIKVRTN